ncbi:tripartite tricarboxylate transporter TctB family protein [Oricola thermophila]|uniref:Tripartite tricarboxylate transporter TctB family protein n=1 Tax=Oricola thermophila TaxID=2742145 RepID=A0A6N1VJA4_9HYPH|nr:tripartite tricarboxylate transporter TctB family protein [Oricola thermophila]QKV18967.1 tripartite tricarboxylate transporter TctB family protein [Oricola thermophila]
MQIHDALIGALLALFGAVVIWHVGSFPVVAGQYYGPDLFPRLIGAGLVLLGGALVLRGRARAGLVPRLMSIPAAFEIRRGGMAALYIVASVASMVLFGEIIGAQILILAILMSGLLARYGRPAVSIPLSIALTVLFDLTFRVLLKVPLPTGLLQDFI